MLTGFSTPLTWVAVNCTGASYRARVTCTAALAAQAGRRAGIGPDRTPACTTQQPRVRLCSLALYRLFMCQERVLHRYMCTRSARVRSWLEGRVAQQQNSHLAIGTSQAWKGDMLKTHPLHSCEGHTRGC